MPRPARRSTVAAVLLALLPALAGCGAPPVACPAIGYLDTLTVHVLGPGAGAVDVEVCVEAACLPRDRDEDGGGFGGFVEAAHRGATWTFTGTFPDRFDVRAYAADGSEVAREAARPSWRRVGGSAQCGGPHAGSVELRL